MPQCAVITCKFGKRSQDANSEGIEFHPFPKDKEVRQKWIELTGREEWEPTKTNFVCSRHFRDCDYTVKRSGKRYLKNAATPCEYVVYHLCSDEEDEVVVVPPPQLDESVDEQSNEAAAEPHEQTNEAAAEPDEQTSKAAAEPDDQPNEATAEPQAELKENAVPGSQPPRDAGFYFHMDPIPSTSREYLAPTMRAARNQEPDSTVSVFETEDTREPWDHFQTEHYFGQRLPASIFADPVTSQEADSSNYDDRFLRDVGSAINPYPPVDLGPHLQQLPFPRTPEPVLVALDDGTQEEMPVRAPSSPPTDHQGRAKLESIKKILTRRKSNKKLIAAALAAVDEAKSLKDKLQAGEMNDTEKATAIIALQIKQIAKLNIRYKRLRKKLKKISGVLRKAD